MRISMDICKIILCKIGPNLSVTAKHCKIENAENIIGTQKKVGENPLTF